MTTAPAIADELVERKLELEALDRVLRLRHKLYHSSRRREDFNPQDWNADTKLLGSAFQRLKKQRERLERGRAE